jgi:cell division protein FtsA
MIKSTDRKLVVGLEIGTTKVAVLVGEILTDNTINIIGIGNCPSKGMDKGNVNDLESIIKCIKKSVNEAEIMADCQISSLYLALSTKDIFCQNEIGIVPISDNEVTKEDIENAIHISKSVKIKHEYNILHVIPKEYAIDQQSGIRNPLGLSGIRMQVDVHLITCHHDIEKNIIKAIEKCGLHVDKLIFSGLAASEAVLKKEEKELGVCMIDIGGGTMDITIYINGSLEHSHVIPYAGNLVTNDIAYAFSISKKNAERIKINYESTIPPVINNTETIEILNVQNDDHSLQKETLIKIIEARYTELLTLVQHEVQKIQEKLYQKGVKNKLHGGIVLTGGAAQMKLLIKYAKKIFKAPVRIGYPYKITGLKKNDQELYYSTIVGLLHYGKDYYLNNEQEIREKKSFTQFLKKINNWFKKEF